MTERETQTYKIKDKMRRLEFQGVKIGHASTRKPTSLRWTEVTIYRTTGGQYVVQREGMSLVYHRADAVCARGEEQENHEIQDGSVPCPECRPPSLRQLDDIADTDTAVYRREVTMSQADVTDEPSQVAAILTHRGRLTTVAVNAIQEATENDKRLEELYGQTEVIS